MSALPRFDDLTALAAIRERGFDAWNAPIIIGAGQVAAFNAVTGAHGDEGHVPGAMLLAMLPVLVPDRGWQVSGYSGAVNLGCSHIRYPVPAPVGAAIAGRSRLVEATPRGQGTVLTAEYEARQVDAAEPCLRAQVQLLYLGGKP